MTNMASIGTDGEVTIILPFRNAGTFLPETLDSVLRQSFQNWRLLLVDDASTDDSVRVAQRFIDGSGGRASLLKLGGVGAAEARNHAMRQAQTRYVAFLDADDVWTANKLEVQLEAMRQTGAAFSYTAFRKMNAASAISPNDCYVPEVVTYKRLLCGNPIRCFTVIYDQHKLGPILMPRIKMRNDLLAWLEILDKLRKLKDPAQDIIPGAREPSGTKPVLGINTVLGFYRQYSASLTGNKLTAARYQWIAYRQYLRLPVSTALAYYARYAINGLSSYFAK
jgi:teichuronic acid biosynthesis glycosyltransferase TuaG